MLQYHFEWDPKKAKLNWKKHKIRFEEAVSVFRDSRSISIFDDAHSDNEDRWITVGAAATGNILVVHHTFGQVDDSNVAIRIFSSRKATKREKRQYLEGA
ncbi:MAG: BrnT family toxin [bacterium]